MAQTEKEKMEDAFIFFLLHVKQKVQERDSAFISEMATSAWAHMNPEERWPYEEQARTMKGNLHRVDFENRLQPQRRYYAKNGEVQMRMAQEIEEKVQALERQNSLKTHPFHLVHVNYYCKHGSGMYLGCEISLAEFSFVDGIRKTYHAFINPGEIPIGYAFMATKHTAKTHQIPLPPDAFGSESNHQEILNNIRLFLMGNSRDKTKVPPLYTRPRDINAVVSVLRQLQRRPATSMKNAERSIFRVYSASKLFHELRNASLGIPSNVILQPNFLDAQELNDDNLQFTVGISCNFHEKLDATQHCSLSCVQRWSFLIMKECCGPLGINMIPGMHCALSSHSVKNTKVEYPGSRICCWEQRNVMVKNELKTKLTPEANPNLQKRQALWQPQRSFPLKPKPTSTALKLMRPSIVTEEDWDEWDEVPAPEANPHLQKRQALWRPQRSFPLKPKPTSTALKLMRPSVVTDEDWDEVPAPEANPHLQKRQALWRPRRSLPLKPLRRPKPTSTALKLMRPSIVTDEDWDEWDEVPAPEANPHLQKRQALWRPRRSFPLKPKPTSTALKLMRPSIVTEEDCDEVPAPLHNLITPGPLPGM
jgi:hypothetical protein